MEKKYTAKRGEHYLIVAERKLGGAEVARYRMTEHHLGWHFKVARDGEHTGYIPAYITRSLQTTLEKNTKRRIKQDEFQSLLLTEICRRLEAGDLAIKNDMGETEVLYLDTYRYDEIATGISIDRLAELLNKDLQKQRGDLLSPA